MADAVARERVRVLMELAGRCLLQYQRIERALKILLPHITKPGVEAQEDAPNWREFLDGRHTLGPLMERFKEVLKSDSLKSAHAHLERIVIERDDLVHHFFTSSGRVLASSEAIESGISELQRRLDHSDSLAGLPLA